VNSRIQFGKWTRVGLAALCLVSTPLAADEILLNSNFSKETDNWSGDFSNDPDTDDPLQPRPSGQISIDLHEHSPVRIFQAFNAVDAHLVCTVKFTLSSGGSYTGTAKVSDVASDVSVNQVASTSYNPSTNVVTVYRNENYATYASSFGTPVLIMADPDDSRVLLYPLGASTTPPSSTPPSMPMTAHHGFGMGMGRERGTDAGTGTAAPTLPDDPAGTTFTVHMDIKPHGGYRLYLAFPPGTGTVTVTKISLQPVTP
jgi:hypothetical protein